DRRAIDGRLSQHNPRSHSLPLPQCILHCGRVYRSGFSLGGSWEWPASIQCPTSYRAPRIHLLHSQLNGRLSILQEMSVAEAGSYSSLLDVQAMRAEDGSSLSVASNVR